MDSKKTLLPALLAVSGGMIGANASAIELGEINVQSALGQPLRASVAFALQPTEQLGDYCISLRPAGPSGGLPSIDAARITVANGVISLAGRSPINEPMASLRLDINCPYTPHLVREFMIFLDPAGSQQAAIASAPAAATRTPARAPATTRRRADTTRPASRPAASLATGERYRVQPGDTLSEIAQRIDNRSLNLWASVNEIFNANPGAFINDDPNLLKAGTWITIPDSARGGQTFVASESDLPANTDSATTAATSQAVASAEPAAAEAPAATYDLVIEPAPVAAPVGVDDTSVLTPAPIEQPAAATQTTADPASVEPLQIGDVIIDEAPEAEADAAATPETTAVETGSSPWGWWFGGAGLLLLGGLAFFARRRNANAPPPQDDEAREEKPKRYLKESPTVEVVESEAPGVQPADPREVDYDLQDDSPTEENLIIDADLEHGTGLDAGVDVDISEDFSFASATELDLELPAEARQEDGDGYEDTVEQEVAIEDQIPPEDDYDMSVLVDVTKMHDAADITERDLQAVIVDDGEDESASDGYTISQEADYDIVTQTFDDDLSATQALNAEIERAAAELAASVGDDVADRVGESMVEEAPEMDLDLDDDDPELETAQMATVTPIDATASLPADESDNTVVNFDDETAEMPQTAEDDDDVTSEMPVRTGKGS